MHETIASGAFAFRYLWIKKQEGNLGNKHSLFLLVFVFAHCLVDMDQRDDGLPCTYM